MAQSRRFPSTFHRLRSVAPLKLPRCVRHHRVVEAFHRLRSVAPLKRRGALVRQPSEVAFHRLRSVAPLKPGSFRDLEPYHRAFHRLRSVAPLKRLRRGDGVSEGWCFPPAQVGGPIEASASAGKAFYALQSFPPAQVGGPIEALTRRLEVSGSRLTFHRLRSVAPLKRGYHS